MISINLHAIGTQRIHDDKDDVLAASVGDRPGIRRAQDSVAFGDRFPSCVRLECESLRAEEAGDQFVFPEQVIAALDAPCHRCAERHGHDRRGGDDSDASDQRPLRDHDRAAPEADHVRHYCKRDEREDSDADRTDREWLFA